MDVHACARTNTCACVVFYGIYMLNWMPCISAVYHPISMIKVSNESLEPGISLIRDANQIQLYSYLILGKINNTCK